MKFAIAQMVLGILIIGLLVWFIGWVEPESGSFFRDIEGYEVELLPLSGWISGVIVWKAVSFLISLAIIVCGFVQYREMRD